MGEIKLRARDKETNNWVEGVTYTLHTSGRLLTTPPHIELTQYTGYKDKKGKDIYEGDIVQADWCWTKPHLIKWPDDQYDFLEYSLDGANVEIIGNIYDDPDLTEWPVEQDE